MSWMAEGFESSNSINFPQPDSESLQNLSLIPDISIHHTKELRITRIVIYRGTLNFKKTQVDILMSKKPGTANSMPCIYSLFVVS